MRQNVHAQLELNFSDFCKYSCISEINYPKKKRIKLSVKFSRFFNSINFENRLISCISENQFSNQWWETDYISKSSTANLWYQPVLCLMFCSPCPEVDTNETGHVRDTFIAILKNNKTIRKASIMVSKNCFTKKSSDDRRWLFHNWEHRTMKYFQNCSDNDN